MIQFERIERLALFGGSWIVAALLPELAARPWRARLFTSPRHLADVVNAEGETLEQVLARTGTSHHCSDEINGDPEALAFAGERTLGIAFGAAWAFTPEFSSRFAGRLLDFMGVALPEYRGGAHYTWQILNGDRRGACNLQLVLGGEESFHRGPLIKSDAYRQPDTARTPQDYFAVAVAEERAFVGAFLDQVERGEQFEAKPLDETAASYFPFLHTKVHGWIDWTRSAGEVERFIGAFGDPYPGASTYWRKRRVFLKSACRREGSFHPFARGLVFRNDACGVWIALADGAVLVRTVTDEQGADLTAGIAVGSRFVTPSQALDEALASEIVYGASGPVVETMLP